MIYYLGHFTDHFIFLTTILVLMGFLRFRISGRQLLQIFTSALIAWLIASFFKNFFYVPRPYIIGRFTPMTDYLLDGSFPSNHAAYTFSLAFSLLNISKKHGYFGIIIAILTAIGRVVAGVHSVYDVLAGALVGLISSRIKLFNKKNNK